MTKKKLIYVTSDESWIRRRKKGKKFHYINPQGDRILEDDLIQRFQALAIPPAYKDVRICPDEWGHIQAVGWDEKGRKQYIYHADWVQHQALQKFDRVEAFGKALPRLRKKVNDHLQKKEFTKEKILAAMVTIMDETNVRVGNMMYAKTHNTFGLTTLRRRHIRVQGHRVLFQFKGKNNTPWEMKLHHPAVSKVIKACVDIPGYQLFKYADETGGIHSLRSEDFNAYLQSLTHNNFTAKDFRTWAASRDLFWALIHTPRDTLTLRKKELAKAIKDVAQKMGHTIAVCKSSYVYPPLMKAYLSGDLSQWMKGRRKQNPEGLLLKWWR